MLFAVDVGNTQTHLGTFRDDELIASWRLATDATDTSDELAARFSALLSLHGLAPSDIEATVVSSVVPRLKAELKRLCAAYFGHECLLVGPDVDTGMPIRIDDPWELGPDRLVNAVAAFDRFRGPCVVVDFGTAITFDAVSRDGEYLGGAISPGVDVSMQALAARAARLPEVDFQTPGSVIGQTTQASLQAGMVYGFAGAIDAIAARLKLELGADTDFVATGGMASSIVPHCESINTVDDLLTLTGLQTIHQRNR